MNLPTTIQRSLADDESKPVTELSRIPAPASSAVAEFFDLDDDLSSPNNFPNSPITSVESVRSEVENEGRPSSASSHAADANKSDTNKTGDTTHAMQISPNRSGSTGSSPITHHSPLSYQTRDTRDTHAEAEAVAAICREFEILIADDAHSLRTAAATLGKPASFFSGEKSMYARFKRHGVAGLLPAQRKAPATGNTMDVPAWFIPAARFFYIVSNRTYNTGSMPEAVRRTISLPHLPFGWTDKMKARFLKRLGLDVLPECPADLREQILARQSAGQPLVTPRLAKQIIVNESLVNNHRSPRDWSLGNQTAPGSQRRFTNQAGERIAMTPGDWFGGDDSTPGIAICVAVSPNDVSTVTSQKFGVLLGRFQWLAYHDARTDKILASDHVIRPRGSYRAEDILNGMGAVVRTHGVPRLGWQFEGGTWNSKLVRNCIQVMGCQHWRTYSPHQKAIEAVFNRVWTRIAVQFPHADMGRYRNENEANCHLYEDCKAGHKDPRKFFPTLKIVVKVFEEEIAAHNSKRINSAQYGAWVPDEFFTSAVSQSPLRNFSPEMEWMLSPYAAERVVKGMMVSCRVPMFEKFSVPFDFGADWMPLFAGKKVRIHFNPRQPKCQAKVVLLENFREHKAGEILGDAQLIGETAGHIRYILEWGDDNQRAGYLARQRVANFVRRETRGIGAAGRVDYALSEQRDGISKVSQIEKNLVGVYSTGSGDPGMAVPDQDACSSRSSAHNGRSARSESPQAETTLPTEDRATRRAELLELEKQTAHLFD